MRERSGKQEYAMGAISLLGNWLAHFGGEALGDVTFRQWFLLKMIDQMGPGEKNVREVADFVGTSRQNVRKMLVPLEERGLLVTQTSRRDARSLDVRLTRKAYDFLEKAEVGMAAETDRLFGSLADEELDQTVEVLRRLLLCVDAYEADEGA